MADTWGPEVKCDQCGEMKPCDWISDPFIREIYGEQTAPEWWCEDCFDEAADAI
jgi:hypothetical protein